MCVYINKPSKFHVQLVNNMEKLMVKTPSFDKHRVWPLVLIGTLCVLLLFIYLYSFICVQNLQIQLEDQGKVIETLKTRINLICAEKLVERDTLETLTVGRSKRRANEEENNGNRNRNRKNKNKRGNKRRGDDKKSQKRNKKDRRQNDEPVDEIHLEEDIMIKERRRKIQAIHLNIDSQMSEPNQPLFLTGPEGSIVNYWEKSDTAFNDNDHFHFNHNGTVTVNQNGLYLMYSQLTYFDSTGRWSHIMDISGKPYIKCLISEWGVDTDPDTGKYYSTAQQCFTSSVAFIRKGDHVSIKSMYPDRNIHADENLSFWGLVHLS